MTYMGTETEYGISTPDEPLLSSIISSTHAVVGYAAVHAAKRRHLALAASDMSGGTQWDFGPETPLRDVRGFDMRRFHTTPVLDPNAIGVANVVLENGGRFYVDHAHPEVSSPETTDPFSAMVYDQAGDVVALEAIRAVRELTEQGLSAVAGHGPCPDIKLYKNNVDGKGASYGSHENYLYRRAALPFRERADALIPFLVTRQIAIGAGRVGLGSHGQESGFQISQRADYIEQPISLETTLNRGIVNTRDEPHTDANVWGRLHIIVGDANMSQVSCALKLGATNLVLEAIELGVRFEDLRLKDPVAAVKIISRDLTLKQRLSLASGEELTALQIQRRVIERVHARVASHRSLSDSDRRLLSLWSRVLDALEKGVDEAAPLVDWAAKYALMRGFIGRGLSWDHPKIKLIDLQYADIDPMSSLYHALVRKGQIETLVDQPTIEQAAYAPPEDSRAWARGMFMFRYPDEVVGANWDRVVLRTAPKSDELATLLLTGMDCGARAQAQPAFEEKTAYDAARKLVSLGDDSVSVHVG